MTDSSRNKKKVKTDKGGCKHQRHSLCQRSCRTCSILALFPHWGPMLVLASRKQRHLHEAKPSTCSSTSSGNLSCRLCRSFWWCLWSASHSPRVVQSRRELFALGQVLWGAPEYLGCDTAVRLQAWLLPSAHGHASSWLEMPSGMLGMPALGSACKLASSYSVHPKNDLFPWTKSAGTMSLLKNSFYQNGIQMLQPLLAKSFKANGFLSKERSK